MRNPLPLAALVQAATMFASIGLVALMGFAYAAGDWLTIKLVLLAAFGSYLAQLFFVWAENASYPWSVRWHGAGSGVYLVVVVLIFFALVRACISWG